MSEQPEALRLADELDTHAHHAMNGEAFYVAGKAAAELRRLQAEIERLVELARADERSIEREACAKVCDRVVGGTDPDDIHSDSQWAAFSLAQAIRARGETK
jgi:hypothetical protein